MFIYIIWGNLLESIVGYVSNMIFYPNSEESFVFFSLYELDLLGNFLWNIDVDSIGIKPGLLKPSNNLEINLVEKNS